MKRKLILIVLIIITFSVHTGVVYAAYPSDKCLWVPVMKQEKSKWCWAACGASTLTYKGYSHTQKGFYVDVFQDYAYTDKGATLAQICTGLKRSHTGHSPMTYATVVYKTIEYSLIQDQIYKNRPIIALREAHAVVVHGYRTETSGNQYVRYMDPGIGANIFEICSEFTPHNYGYIRDIYR
ncbi:MAG: C39 family peptidase [Clostridia bacterium]|jgi:hypothetical protein